MNTSAFTIEPEGPDDGPAISQLLDVAFGPDRHNKTSYRLRDGVAPPGNLSFVARHDGELVGTIRFWPVRVGAMETGVLLLGPLAVSSSIRGQGCGLALMRHGLNVARTAGYRLVLLVGDLPYYAKAGFARVPGGRLAMPGPVDPARLLYAELVSGAMDGVGGAVRRDAAG